MKKRLLLLAVTGVLLVSGCAGKGVEDYVNSNQNSDQIKDDEITESDKDSDKDSDQQAMSESEAEEKDIAIEGEAKDEADGTKTGLYQGASASKWPVDITFDYRDETVYNDDSTQMLFNCSYSVASVSGKDERVVSAIDKALSDKTKEITETSKSYADKAKAKYDTDGESFNGYYISYGFFTSFHNDRVISLDENMGNYTDNARFDERKSAINFDQQTGKELTLDDICSDKQAFVSSAISSLKEQLAGKAYDAVLKKPADSLGKDLEEDIVIDGNWSFSTAGIRFIFNSDIITEDAAGSFQITVPYESLNGIKEEYVFNKVLAKCAVIGNDISADLDGNGILDNITYDVTELEDGNVEFKLVINDEDYSNIVEEAGITFNSTARMVYDYYLVDLDSSDEFIELAIKDYGYSDDPTTTFFRYDESGLYSIGYIANLIGTGDVEVCGDGIIYVNTVMNIFETAYINAKYQLSSSRIDQVHDLWYDIREYDYYGNNGWHEILKDFAVYKENSLDSEKVILSSDIGKVKIPATDNKEWVVVELEDGSYYYLNIREFAKLEDGSYVTDVFQDILLAG